MQQASPAQSECCVQLKGSLVPMTVMELLEEDRQQIESTLMATIAQAPGFFENSPVIISLEKFADTGEPIDFALLVSICEQLRIKPVAVRGGSELQQLAAQKSGLATLPASKSKTPPIKQTPATTEQKTEPVAETPKTEAPVAEAQPEAAEKETPPTTEEPADKRPPAETKQPTKIVYQPVRSGQQVYAQGGDLIVLAAVSPGAEILADGNVHVYGPLRGRALAGVRGDTKARIFCQSLEAELVSIAGQYKISEDLQQSGWKEARQIYLSDDKLTISPLQP